MRRASLAALLTTAAALAACSPSPASAPADAGVADAAGDAADDAAPPGQADVGPWGSAGARITKLLLTRPAAFTIGCDFGPCPVAAPPAPVLLRTRAVAGGVELRVGTGAALDDGGVTFTFADQLTPASTFASAGAPYDGASGARRPFATHEPVTWSFVMFPDQPGLEIRSAAFGGSLDSQDRPTSDDPALGGRVTGCFTPAAAQLVYIDVLVQNLRQLIEASGGALDVDCTGSGTLDGYAFEAEFEASDVVQLQDPGSADGG